MARVLTNNTSLQVGIQPTGLDSTPLFWKMLEPNTISTLGADISTVVRTPISKNRQRQAGTITDLDSAFEYDGDLTMDEFGEFIEGFSFAIFTGPVASQSGANFDNLSAVLATSAFAHDAFAAALLVNHLVFTRAFATAANNGLWMVSGVPTTILTPCNATPIGAANDADDIVNETPSEELQARMDVCGYQFQDLVWTTATSTLSSAAALMDTVGLTVGQILRVGDADAATQFPLGDFFGRVVTIAAGSVVLDKLTDIGVGTQVGTNGASDIVNVLFGRFLRNVSVDDSDFIERYFQFEAAWDDLGGIGTPEYEYSLNNLCNQLTFNLPIADKAGLTFGFIGTDTEVPTTSRKSGASTPVQAVQTEAFNTTSDIARLRVTEADETGISTDFKSITITVNNNVSPEKVVGTLGAAFMNTGNFEVDIESQLVFTDSTIITAIRNNTTVTMEWIINNNDGGFAVDIPSMKLGGGGKELPVNESVLISFTGAAFEDATLGYSMSVSIFPYLP